MMISIIMVNGGNGEGDDVDDVDDGGDDDSNVDYDDGQWW